MFLMFLVPILLLLVLVMLIHILTAPAGSVQDPVHHHPVGAQEAEVQHLLLEQKHGGHERNVIEIQDVVDNFVRGPPQVLAGGGDIAGIVARETRQDAERFVQFGDMSPVPISVLKPHVFDGGRHSAAGLANCLDALEAQVDEVLHLDNLVFHPLQIGKHAQHQRGLVLVRRVAESVDWPYFWISGLRLLLLLLLLLLFMPLLLLGQGGIEGRGHAVRSWEGPVVC